MSFQCAGQIINLKRHGFMRVRERRHGYGVVSRKEGGNLEQKNESSSVVKKANNSH